MKTCSIFVLTLIFDFYYLGSSGLSDVPCTEVVTPPTTTQASMNIYYDAMEEKCQVFFNTTLVEEYSWFSPSVDLFFIPCQQAKDNNGDLCCPAQADPSCNMDKIHSCAIAQTTNHTQIINFLACTMSSVQKIPDSSTCATQNQINDQQLQCCATSDTGKNLCKDHSAQKMPNSETIPGSQGVDKLPGIIFKKQNDNQKSDPFENMNRFINYVYMTDFKSALCAQLAVIRASAKPKECKQSQKLLVGIFYKTMDEKSQKWFQMFATAYDNYSQYLNFKYVPCMFAELSESGELDCKDEADKGCVVAKTHACAISIVTDPKALFSFLCCIMKDATKTPDFQKCATESNIAYEPIKKCSECDTGKQLCYDYSRMKPKSDSIPSFSYALTFDESISEETSKATGQKSLKDLLCPLMTVYSEDNIHPDCFVQQLVNPETFSSPPVG